jgi:hypothetical protein
MAKDHGARQQKKAAKQKAKRSAKRSESLLRNSLDPTIRLLRAEHWPVVDSLVGSELWKQGIGYLAIARQESEGRLVFAQFLVDVFCLGVKNALWHSGSRKEFDDQIRHLTKVQRMASIAPECLVKIVTEAVLYAQSFGFRPHPDYDHASKLFSGIDPAACHTEYTFGRDGKPLYIQGPNESSAQAAAITQRVKDAGGIFLIQLPMAGSNPFAGSGEDSDERELLEEDYPSEEWR